MIQDLISARQNEATELSSQLAKVSSPEFPYTYHEISQGDHVLSTDVLEQLRRNLAQLEDLQGRLSFMMGELRSLIRK